MGGVNVFQVGVNMDVLVSSLCLFIVVAITIFFEAGVHFLEKWVIKTSEIRLLNKELRCAYTAEHMF